MAKQLAVLKTTVFLYNVFFIMAIGIVVFLAFPGLKKWLTPAAQTNEKLPYYAEIMQVLNSVEYSGFPDLLKQETTLSIDFEKREWTLHNIHKFDNQGKIILKDGRYGLCGELAAHTQNKLQPILAKEKHFKIKFVRAAESGYFLTPQSSHTAVVLSDTAKGQDYLLDPSFHRYGKIEDFDEYLYFGTFDTLPFLEGKIADVNFPADSATPLLIRHDYMLNFSVESTSGKFDKDNFILGVGANRRYKFSGRYIYALRRVDGVEQMFQNEWLAEEVLTHNEFSALKKKMQEWMTLLSV